MMPNQQHSSHDVKMREKIEFGQILYWQIERAAGSMNRQDHTAFMYDIIQLEAQLWPYIETDPDYKCELDSIDQEYATERVKSRGPQGEDANKIAIITFDKFLKKQRLLMKLMKKKGLLPAQAKTMVM